MVQVVLRESTSTSPDCRAVKRCCAVNGVYLTLLASPNTAAATARQTSTSRPFHTPFESGWEKPARPVLTPHCTKPFFCTASSVPWAWRSLMPSNASANAPAHPTGFFMRFLLYGASGRIAEMAREEPAALVDASVRPPSRPAPHTAYGSGPVRSCCPEGGVRNRFGR